MKEGDMASFRKEVRGAYTQKRVTRADLKGNQKPKSSARDEDVEGADKPPSSAPIHGQLGITRSLRRPAVRRYLG
jgi:hypothetical protein